MRVVFLVAIFALAAAVPNPAVNYNAHVFLNVTYAGGYTTIYNGVFNQDSYIFAGDYEDNTGYRFSEVYKVTGPSHKLCTNYEVHGELCELGCNAGVSCQNHSCTCGAAYGMFEYLSGATASGSCGPANGGSQFTQQVAQTDDDYGRGQTINYCFDGDTPISIYKKYATSVSVSDLVSGQDLGAGLIRKLAPEHVRITEITIKFNSWSPMHADPKAFVQPANCQC